MKWLEILAQISFAGFLFVLFGEIGLSVSSALNTPTITTVCIALLLGGCISYGLLSLALLLVDKGVDE